MVGTLREAPGTLGLATGLGWYVSNHSIGIYGTDPPVARTHDDDGLPDGTVVETAAGFAWADPQAAVGSLPQCSPDADAKGEVTVETYSVSFGRDGSPERAVVACRTPEGRRAWAKVTDADHLAVLVTEEGCGRLATLRPDGRVDLR
jgi:acetyl-CoA C-acetyltransferase